MAGSATIVVDIGKTNAKLSLWSPEGRLIDRSVRANETCTSPAGYRRLDVAGIDAWLVESLAAWRRHGGIGRIIPVAHGAAVAVLRGGALFADPMDYEEPVDADCRRSYDEDRDPFTATGSPALPCGLNLGVQLHRLEALLGPLPEDAILLPWAQYWAWRLCGVAASEVTSLGCHSDLWFPDRGEFSALAQKRGWAARFAPLRPAAAALGTITADVASQTGLDPACEVLCGMHDSNAALVAARGHREIAGADSTVLSTGTWFVAMRTPAGPEAHSRPLSEARDCLVNVDVRGRSIPSARFMGGREFELSGGLSSFDIAGQDDTAVKLERLPALLESGAGALPTFVPGVGPFPDAEGTWYKRPDDPPARVAAAELYLALMADTALDLIGSRDHLLVEGRFANAELFVRALAALRPRQRVYTSLADHDVAYGALRLVDPLLPPTSGLKPVAALQEDLDEYARRWREQAPMARRTL